MKPESGPFASESSVSQNPIVRKVMLISWYGLLAVYALPVTCAEVAKVAIS